MALVQNRQSMLFACPLTWISFRGLESLVIRIGALH
jgi:hypothetical protein